ncbi:Uncharacterised protein [Klebsiella pneumoniae]|nr:Uncharacterised protein [Klebsiella pneumoniae]
MIIFALKCLKHPPRLVELIPIFTDMPVIRWIRSYHSSENLTMSILMSGSFLAPVE